MMAKHFGAALDSTHSDSGLSGGGLLWPLVAIAAALVCWSVGEDWRQEMTPLTQQLKSASALGGRGQPQEIEALRRQVEQAGRQRQAIEAKLKSEVDLELVRAYLNADLRRLCVDSLAKNCVVRLADTALASRPGPGAAPTNPGSGGLASLGVMGARATVSGLFETDEPIRLLKSLGQDAGRTWRTNGVVVRGNSFEVDVERLVLTPATASKP
jgi:hypothetical protein